MLLSGTQLRRYKIVQIIGSGGMGEVYLAEDPKIGQYVAIKIIKTEATLTINNNTMKLMQEFWNEARAIASLEDHPHILPLLDYGEEQIQGDTVAYIVMPYRKEGNLVQWLHRQAVANQLLPIERGALIKQAALALQYAHNHNIIHRDVKPQNFLVRENATTPRQPDLLLADFGLAKFMTATSNATQKPRGTPNYMAPEQWNGKSVPASDQYALAVMAYELLAGRLPFQGNPFQMMNCHLNVPPPPPRSFNPALPLGVDDVLLCALKKDPDERYPSVMDLAENLLKALSGVPYATASMKNGNQAGARSNQASAGNNQAGARGNQVNAGSPAYSGTSPYSCDPVSINKAYSPNAAYRSSPVNHQVSEPKKKKTPVATWSMLVGILFVVFLVSVHPWVPSTPGPIYNPTPTPNLVGTPTPADTPVPTDTPTPSAVWDVTFNSAGDSLVYLNDTLTNPNTTHFLSIAITFVNQSSQTQAINAGAFDLRDRNGNHYQLVQTATGQSAMYVDPGRSAQVTIAYVVPDNECSFTLTYTDPSGQPFSQNITENNAFCTA